LMLGGGWLCVGCGSELVCLAVYVCKGVVGVDVVQGCIHLDEKLVETVLKLS